MVGDSAVTQMRGSKVLGVVPGAVKVQYSANANIGISMWGYGQVNGTPLDKWISEFICTSVTPTDTIETVGSKLASQINAAHILSGKPWKELVCGFHLGGYIEGLPHLYHVHCGHESEPPHELRLYRDFPIDHHWDTAQFQDILNNGYCHLRNGCHPLFAPLFDSIMEYSKKLDARLGITFPQDNIEGRLLFYKELVKFVAGVLAASGIHRGVNDTLSAIAFDKKGIAFDQQLPFTLLSSYGNGILSYYY